MTTITELSKKTLGSYINKAGTDRHNAGYRAAKDPKTLVKNTVKSIKRAIGIEKAVKRLTKEDVQPLIIAAASGSAVDFTNVFEELITNKIADLVEAKKEEIASTLLDEASAVKSDNKLKKNIHTVKTGQKNDIIPKDIRVAFSKGENAHERKQTAIKTWKRIGRSELNK